MTSNARTAILVAARELFYVDGITATGVDAVVRSAGVTKPTLYAQFGSKAELVVAVLRQRREERRGELEAWLEGVPAAERPVAVLHWLEHFYASDGDRGCGFLNAAAELGEDAPARSEVRAEKDWLLDLLVAGCAAAGCREPRVTGSQLLLLVDGVAGRAVVGGRVAAQAAAVEARQAAEVLVAAGR